MGKVLLLLFFMTGSCELLCLFVVGLLSLAFHYRSSYGLSNL